MTMKKNALMVAMGLVLACGVATGASAETRWGAEHPRQHEVFHRLAVQNQRIRAERRDSEISGREAHRLHVADRRIAHQDRRDARINGGFITKSQQHQLNREENGVSRRIG